MQAPLITILVNVRSAQNVGSIFRTADGAGASGVWTVGITPHPRVKDDLRPAHVIIRAERLLAKTALGAEASLPHRHFTDLASAVAAARLDKLTILALEQSDGSTGLFNYAPSGGMAMVVGPEVGGLIAADLDLCDHILEIPMRGSKESLNVAVAAGIALYRLRRE